MIKWGILGAGKIAFRFAKSLRNLSDCTLYAISGRSEEKLHTFSQSFPCERIYSDYDGLLRNPDVDAIYLSLPHGLHCEWAVKALSAGKAVLCEKPAALNAEQMRTIQRCASERGVLFMEAMKTRFTPLYRQIKEMVAKGAIGDLTRIDTMLCIMLPPESYGKTYHTDLTQGGCLLDCGIYCASWLEDYAAGNAKLEGVHVNFQRNVDFHVKASLKIGETDAFLETAFDRSGEKKVILYGKKGRIEIPNLHRATKAVFYQNGAKHHEMELNYEHDDFYGQIRHFCNCFSQGMTESDVMPLNASVRCAGILDTIREGFSQ